MVPFKHTISCSNSEIDSPLPDPERLIRGASLRRILQTSSSSSSLCFEDISSVDPFSFVPSNPDWTKLPPRVSKIHSKGVDLALAFLIHLPESYQVPSIPIKSPSSEEELGLHLPEFKPTNFISPNTYYVPSNSNKLEETFFVYSNPLFENREDSPSRV